MASKFRLFAFFLLSIVLLINCATSSKLSDLGLDELKNDNFGIAAEKLKKAVIKDESNGDAHYGLAKYFLYESIYDTSLYHVEKAVICNIDSAKQLKLKILSELCVELKNEGKLDSALALCEFLNNSKEFQPSIKFKRLFSELYYHEAQSSLNNGNELEALDKLDKALEIYPKNIAAKKERGTLYLKLSGIHKKNGNLSNALDFLEAAATDNPLLTSTSNFNQKQIYEYLYDYGNAIRTAEISIKDPLYYYESCYDLSRFNSILYSHDNAVRYLSQFYHHHEDIYDYYRYKSKSCEDFYTLRDNDKFLRWLNKIRRLKLSVSSVEYKEAGKYLPDSYITVTSQNDSVLLASNVNKNNRNPVWHENELYVIFDHQVGDTIKFYLFDQKKLFIPGVDLVKDKILAQISLDSVYTDSIELKNKSVIFKLKIFDNQNTVYSSNIIPPNDFTVLDAWELSKDKFVRILEIDPSSFQITFESPSANQVAAILFKCGIKTAIQDKYRIVSTVVQVLFDLFVKHKSLLQKGSEELLQAFINDQLEKRLNTALAKKFIPDLVNCSLCTLDHLNNYLEITYDFKEKEIDSKVSN